MSSTENNIGSYNSQSPWSSQIDTFIPRGTKRYINKYHRLFTENSVLRFGGKKYIGTLMKLGNWLILGFSAAFQPSFNETMRFFEGILLKW